MAISSGTDEFCMDCMEWREYDEEGRCIVCKKIIRKERRIQDKNGYSSYKSETYDEIDEPTDISE